MPAVFSHLPAALTDLLSPPHFLKQRAGQCFRAPRASTLEVWTGMGEGPKEEGTTEKASSPVRREPQAWRQSRRASLGPRHYKRPETHRLSPLLLFLPESHVGLEQNDGVSHKQCQLVWIFIPVPFFLTCESPRYLLD